MKILSWNVNGLRAVLRHGLLDFLEQERPDVLALQEIKITLANRQNLDFDFASYDEYWHPAHKSGYSGTAILAKLKPRQVRAGIGIKEFDREGRVQTLEYSKFYLVNVYFPNANHQLSRLDFKLKFNQALLKYLKKLEIKKPLIVGGDFNVAHQEIDLANPKTNFGNAGFTKEERAWMDKFIDAGLIDTFRFFHKNKVQYSWWSYRFKVRARNIGWRIDYFLVSEKMKKQIKSAFILDKIMGSDHCPVGIEIF